MLARRRAASLVAALLAAPAGASADVLYSNDFEWGPPGAEWSSGTTSWLPAYTQYLGRFSLDQSAVLTIGAPSPSLLGPGESFLYTVEFDFYVIDSWDGFEPVNGQDWLRVGLNGVVGFDETFANQHTMQSFRPPDIGPVHLGYNPSFKDSTYHNIQVTFADPGSAALAIAWQGNAMQGIADESWGIDNISVSYSVVPTPGAAALLALGGATILGRRRRAA